MLKTRHNKDVTNRTNAIYAKSEIELFGPIRLSVVYDKNRTGNDVTDRTSVVYTKNNTELLWPIRSGVDCDENQIRQLRDWL